MAADEEALRAALEASVMSFDEDEAMRRAMMLSGVGQADSDYSFQAEVRPPTPLPALPAPRPAQPPAATHRAPRAGEASEGRAADPSFWLSLGDVLDEEDVGQPPPDDEAAATVPSEWVWVWPSGVEHQARRRESRKVPGRGDVPAPAREPPARQVTASVASAARSEASIPVPSSTVFADSRPRALTARDAVTILTRAMREMSPAAAAQAVVTGEIIGVAVDFSNISVTARRDFDAMLNIAMLAKALERSRPSAPHHCNVAGSALQAVEPGWATRFRALGYGVRVEQRALGSSELAVDERVQNFARAFVTAAVASRMKIQSEADAAGVESPPVRFVLVLVTGDANDSGRGASARDSFLHVVREALELGVVVEVVSWSHACSSAYSRLQPAFPPGALRVVPLDRNPGVDISSVLRWNTRSSALAAIRRKGLSRPLFARGGDGVPDSPSPGPRFLASVVAFDGPIAEVRRAAAAGEPLGNAAGSASLPGVGPAAPGLGLGLGPGSVPGSTGTTVPASTGGRSRASSESESSLTLDVARAISGESGLAASRILPAVGQGRGHAESATSVRVAPAATDVATREASALALDLSDASGRGGPAAVVGVLTKAFPAVGRALTAHHSSITAVSRAIADSERQILSAGRELTSDGATDAVEAGRSFDERLRSLRAQHMEFEAWADECCADFVEEVTARGGGKAALRRLADFLERDSKRFAAGLPFYAQRRALVEQLVGQRSPFAVIVGETGSGKSTQLPAILAECGIARPAPGSRALVSQPRAVGAMSLASRVAHEWGCEVGGAVGLVTDDVIRVSPDSLLVFTTHDRLLRQLALDIQRCNARVGAFVGAGPRPELGDGPDWAAGSTDPDTHRWMQASASAALGARRPRPADKLAPWPLPDFGTVVFDEAHERSVVGDTLLGLLANVCRGRHAASSVPPLKMLVASATIDEERLAAYLSDCPTLSIPGRAFPVPAQCVSLDAVMAERAARLAEEPESRLADARLGVAATSARGVSGGTARGVSGSSAGSGAPAPLEEESGAGGDVARRAAQAAAWQVLREYQREVEAGESGGDVLCFLPSVRELAVAKAEFAGLLRLLVRAPKGRAASSLPAWQRPPLVQTLHEGMDASAQQEVLSSERSGRRRVIFATSVAETSLTVENVVAVVDTGLEERVQYDRARRMETVMVSPVSKASAQQRRGRAGRTRPGRCIRLFSDEEFDTMEAQREPEILRVDLSHSVVRLLAAGGDPLRFVFLEPPPVEAMADAIDTLRLLGAVTVDRPKAGRTKVVLTRLGSLMHRLDLPPMVAATVLAGVLKHRCPQAAVEAGALLASGGDSALVATDGRAAAFASDLGDIVTLVRVYRAWKGHLDFGSRSDLCMAAGVRERILTEARQREEAVWNVLVDAKTIKRRPDAVMQLDREIQALRRSAGATRTAHARGGEHGGTDRRHGPSAGVGTTTRLAESAGVRSLPGALGTAMPEVRSSFAGLADGYEPDGRSGSGRGDDDERMLSGEWTEATDDLSAVLRTITSLRAVRSEEDLLAQAVTAGFFLHAGASNGDAAAGYSVVRNAAPAPTAIIDLVRAELNAELRRVLGLSPAAADAITAPSPSADADAISVALPHRLSVLALSASAPKFVVFSGMARAGRASMRGLTRTSADWLAAASAEFCTGAGLGTFARRRFVSRDVKGVSNSVRDRITGRGGAQLAELEESLGGVVVEVRRRSSRCRIWAEASDADVAKMLLQGRVDVAETELRAEVAVLPIPGSARFARAVLGAGATLRRVLLGADEVIRVRICAERANPGPRPQPFGWADAITAVEGRVAALLQQARDRAAALTARLAGEWAAAHGSMPEEAWSTVPRWKEPRGAPGASLPPRTWADTAAWAASVGAAGDDDDGEGRPSAQELLSTAAADAALGEIVRLGVSGLRSAAPAEQEAAMARAQAHMAELTGTAEAAELLRTLGDGPTAVVAVAESLAARAALDATCRRVVLSWRPLGPTTARRAMAEAVLATPSLQRLVSTVLEGFGDGAGAGIFAHETVTYSRPDPRLEATGRRDAGASAGTAQAAAGDAAGSGASSAAAVLASLPQAPRPVFLGSSSVPLFAVIRLAWRLPSPHELGAEAATNASAALRPHPVAWGAANPAAAPAPAPAAVSAPLPRPVGAPARHVGRTVVRVGVRGADTPLEHVRLGALVRTVQDAGFRPDDRLAQAFAAEHGVRIAFRLETLRATPRSVTFAVVGLPDVIPAVRLIAFAFRVLEAAGVSSTLITVVDTTAMRPLQRCETAEPLALAMGVDDVPSGGVLRTPGYPNAALSGAYSPAGFGWTRHKTTPSWNLVAELGSLKPTAIEDSQWWTLLGRSDEAAAPAPPAAAASYATRAAASEPTPPALLAAHAQEAASHVANEELWSLDASRLFGHGDDPAGVPGGPATFPNRVLAGVASSRDTAEADAVVSGPSALGADAAGLSDAQVSFITRSGAQVLREIESFAPAASLKVVSAKAGLVVAEARLSSASGARNVADSLNGRPRVAGGEKLWARAEYCCSVTVPAAAARNCGVDLRGLWAHFNGYEGDSGAPDGYLAPEGTTSRDAAEDYRRLRLDKKRNGGPWVGDGRVTAPPSHRVRLGGLGEALTLANVKGAPHASCEIWASAPSRAVLDEVREHLNLILARCSLGDPETARPLRHDEMAAVLRLNTDHRGLITAANSWGAFFAIAPDRSSIELWAPPLRLQGACRAVLEAAGIRIGPEPTALVELRVTDLRRAFSLGMARLYAAVALRRLGSNPADALGRLPAREEFRNVPGIRIRILQGESAIEIVGDTEAIARDAAVAIEALIAAARARAREDASWAVAGAPRARGAAAAAAAAAAAVDADDADDTLDGDCPVCYTPLVGGSCFSTVCGHSFHAECLAQHMASTRRRDAISCPSCDALSPLADVRAVLGEEGIRKRARYVLAAAVSRRVADRTIGACPTSGCGELFDQQACLRDADGRLDCPACREQHCVKCSSSWHEGMTCQEATDMAAAAAASAGEESREPEFGDAAEAIVPCSHCKAPLQREAGCNHLQCDACGAHFCFRCGFPWQKGATADQIYLHMKPEQCEAFRAGNVEWWKLKEADVRRRRTAALAQLSELRTQNLWDPLANVAAELAE